MFHISLSAVVIDVREWSKNNKSNSPTSCGKSTGIKRQSRTLRVLHRANDTAEYTYDFYKSSYFYYGLLSALVALFVPRRYPIFKPAILSIIISAGKRVRRVLYYSRRILLLLLLILRILIFYHWIDFLRQRFTSFIK